MILAVRKRFECSNWVYFKCLYDLYQKIYCALWPMIILWKKNMIKYEFWIKNFDIISHTVLFFAMLHSYFRQKYQNKIHFNSSTKTKTAALSLHYHILTCLRVSLVKWKWISYSKLQHRKKQSLNVFKNLFFLNSNGVNNFNYPVSVH